MEAAASKSFIKNHQLLSFFTMIIMIPLPVLCIDTFIYNGFIPSDLLLDGAVLTTSATPRHALKLTNKSHHVIGHAFHPTPLKLSSFSTHFIFQITPAPTNHRGGYGLAFTLSPSPHFPNPAAGHYLGVLNPANDALASNHIFMVEFDTVNGHNSKEDSDGNHIGINVNSMDSTASTPASYIVSGGKHEDVFLEKAGPIQAWIDYDEVNRVINVTISPLLIPKPSSPLISHTVNLAGVLQETVYAGFSAATGDKASSHYILGWSFRLKTAAGAPPLNQSELPIIPVEAPPSSSNSRRIRIAVIVTFSIILLTMAVAFVSVVYYRRVMKFQPLEDWELDCPHRFLYKDLHRATKGFHDSEKIGAGGFGAVYRGVLSTASAAASPEVAVKKIISKNSSSHGMREFAAEIESLGRLRHKNLVNLQGWCKHKNDLLLVYDYISNGSLNSLLYVAPKTGMVLSWEHRFNIIKGIGCGLLYLHEEWEKVVIHRDVKSSNILIDCDMNARLGDFGLARLYDHGQTSYTTNIVGTIGYIAPEFARTGKASASTDVFAYGILLLEVACGRAPVVFQGDRNVILVDWVMECMRRGEVLDVVDEKLNGIYSREEMELVLELGLVCSHPKPEWRPSMKKVMKYLNGDEVVDLVDRLSVELDCLEINSRLMGLTTSSSSLSFQTMSSVYGR